MEAPLDKLLDSFIDKENTIGLLLSKDSLCCAARGVASENSAGIITAIVDQAAKIHPNLNAPVVVFESTDKEVHIAKYGSVTAAVYKKKSNK